MTDSELAKVLEAIKDTKHEPLFSHKNVNTLVLGAVAAVGVYLWQAPTRAADTFSQIKEQTTEVRATLNEMKSLVSGLNSKLDAMQAKTEDQGARVAAIEAQIKNNDDRISTLEAMEKPSVGHK